jgi:hypothetical protein
MTERQRKRAATQREREVRDKTPKSKLETYPIPYEVLPAEPDDDQEQLINA